MIELLVVMGIIMILVTIAMPVAMNARNKAKDTEVKAGCNTIQAALESYAVDHGACYPGAHWEVDSSNVLWSGPGVLGALPTYDGNTPHKDFAVPHEAVSSAASERGYLLPDLTTPDPSRVDELVVGGYVTDYPANPFLKATGSAKSQMSNLFFFLPRPGQDYPRFGANPVTLDWDRYTNAAGIGPMRAEYKDYGAGHFTYIPLNPVNNLGVDFEGNWGALSDSEYQEYYKRCRGYMLIGWGNSRLDDTQAKGVSEKYYVQRLDGFDFDNSGMLDRMEYELSQTSTGTSFVYPELNDGEGNYSGYGAVLPGGGPNIDAAFYGAVYFKISGS
jgi:type II secretory pathway pseudopilin PulG